jgi:heme/copper-type cytochrome/quinol oxidase subunit 2
MRIFVLGMCALVAAGVFVTMFLSIWSSRRTCEETQRLSQSAISEFVWMLIPCLMMIAAAIPAAIAITHK